jgi:hypothetical protein
MTLHSSQIGGTAVATAALKSTTESKKSTGTSFSAALKDASTTAESTTTAKKAPSGEKTRAVEGHKYADVIAGPRKGMYINTGSNTRSGEAFVMVKKNGREYHIYGTGENRRVIGLRPADEKKNEAVSTTDTSTTDTSATPTGTTDTGKINTDASTTS